MYRNAELKADARFHLRGAWGYAILISVIISFVQGIITSVSGRFTGTSGYYSVFIDIAGRSSLSAAELRHFVQMLPKIMLAALITQVVGMVVKIAFTLPFEVSCNNWFIRNRETPAFPPLEMLFNHFGSNYVKLLGARAWELLWLFIWSLPSLIGAALLMIYNFRYLLPIAAQEADRFPAGPAEIEELFMQGLPLFIIGSVLVILGLIPLINRSFAYAMNPYILADNPEIGYRRSLELSKEMMKGHKFRFFLLQLSFIGWIFLGLMVCGVGIIVVRAYMNQTFAEFYGAVRSMAVADGKASMEEFGFSRSFTDAQTYPTNMPPFMQGQGPSASNYYNQGAGQNDYGAGQNNYGQNYGPNQNYGENQNYGQNPNYGPYGNGQYYNGPQGGGQYPGYSQYPKSPYSGRAYTGEEEAPQQGEGSAYRPEEAGQQPEDEGSDSGSEAPRDD